MQTIKLIMSCPCSLRGPYVTTDIPFSSMQMKSCVRLKDQLPAVSLKLNQKLQGKPQITPMAGDCCGQAQCRGGRSQLLAVITLQFIHSFIPTMKTAWGGSQSSPSRRLLLLSPTKNHGMNVEKYSQREQSPEVVKQLVECWFIQHA